MYIFALPPFTCCFSAMVTCLPAFSGTEICQKVDCYCLLACFAFNGHLILRKGQDFRLFNSFKKQLLSTCLDCGDNSDPMQMQSLSLGLTFLSLDLYEIILIFNATVLVIGYERQMLGGSHPASPQNINPLSLKQKPLTVPLLVLQRAC